MVENRPPSFICTNDSDMTFGEEFQLKRNEAEFSVGCALYLATISFSTENSVELNIIDGETHLRWI